MLFSFFRHRRTALAAPKPGRAHPRSLAARVAVYEVPGVPPRLLDVTEISPDAFLARLVSVTHQLVQERGGSIPFVVIQEVIENLVHASFREAVITISSNGNTLSIADHGPGVSDKDKALRPGFSTASASMKRLIKGVGSGLVVAREALAQIGGEITIEDNLGSGAVVTLSVENPRQAQADTGPQNPTSGAGVAPAADEYSAAASQGSGDGDAVHTPQAGPALSSRQRRVLQLIGDEGTAGPSTVANRLHTSLSTAYRDLVALEDMGLVEADEAGKRRVTAAGYRALAGSRDAGQQARTP